MPKVTQQVSGKTGTCTQAIVPKSILLTIIPGDNYAITALGELQSHKIKSMGKLDEGREFLAVGTREGFPGDAAF